MQEDPSILQHIKLALPNFSKPLCSEKSSFFQENGDLERDDTAMKVDDDIVDNLVLENLFSSTERIEFDQERPAETYGNLQVEFTADSPDECSNGCEHNQETEDSFAVEGVNGGGASQVQSWHFFEDDFSNGFQCSMNSSDCISEAIVNPENRNPEISRSLHLKQPQECNHLKLTYLDLGPDNDASHYKRTVATILGNSQPLNETETLRRCCGCKSSFVSWKVFKGHSLQQEQQKLLKRILFKIPLMYEHSLTKNPQEQSAKSCVLSAKNKENEKFSLLRSMVPSSNEVIGGCIYFGCLTDFSER